MGRLRAVAAAALLLALCQQEAAGQSRASSAPQRNDFPARTGRIVDQANLLTTEQEAALMLRLAALEDRTASQLVIVTVPSLGGRTIEAYAQALGDNWGVGGTARFNGVLLVVAPNERKVRIAVGRGLARIFPDADAATIINRDLLPHFRRSDFPGGIDAGARSIETLLIARTPAAAGRAR